MMDADDNKIAIYDKGIEVKCMEPLQVEAEHFVRTQTAPFTGLNHARTVGPILE
jgi:hypothetical protein